MKINTTQALNNTPTAAPIPAFLSVLLSYLNTKLSDEYSSLAELCAALDADEAAVQETLAALDYRYSPEQNQFI